MGSSNDGSDTLTGAEDPTEGNQRGFLSRIFNALSPSDPSTDDAGTGSGSVVPQAPALHGIGNLRRMRVDDVVIPKVEITAVPESIGLDELVAVFKEHGFSRLPVYAEDLDHPLGQVLLKDIALQFGFGAGGGAFSLTPLIRPVLYSAPSMPIGVLLQKMQKERVHMALVIDEYGGVDGLVTIEDLIETVIGEIDDEHDDEDAKLWVLEKPGVYLVQARAPLDEFEHAVGLKLRDDEDDEDIDTLGGLVFLRSGRVPSRGEIVPHESGAEFEIVEADPRTIKRLRLRMPNVVAGPALLPAPKT